MKFVEACNEAYRKAIQKAKKEKEDSKIELMINGEYASIEVWNDGDILFQSGKNYYLRIEELNSDDWSLVELNYTK